MEKNRILELLARKMGQTATPQELEELEKLLKEFPEYHFLKDTTESMQMDFYPAGAGEERALVEKNWDFLAQAMEGADGGEQGLEGVGGGWRGLEGPGGVEGEKELEGVDGGWRGVGGAGSGPGVVQRPGVVRRMVLRRVVRVAAAVAGVVVIGGGIYYGLHREKAAATIELIAKNGEKVRQLLPDSTFVRLNAGSELTYAPGYGKTNREVYLRGEAFFDVAPDKDRPFLVHAGRLIIKVLGTSFNVRSYAKDSAVETTLIKGKVEVQLNNGAGKRIVLMPNEKLTVSNGAPAAEKQPLIHLNDTTGYNEVAWIDNKLVFWNEPFEKVAEKMERWYNVRIHFTTPALMNEVLSGTFEKETPEQALNILRMTTDFSFSIDGNDIYLK